LFCTVNEICDENNDKCIYADKDCSGNNIDGISTCGYNPDNNPFTHDDREAFLSICDEANDACTSGSEDITHECDKTNCGAACELGDTTSCEAAGGYSGTKACTNSCNWGECRTDEYCGDGIVNDGEECDTTSTQACTDANGYAGTKTCTGCMWSECVTTESCGDGIINDGEECDGSLGVEDGNNGVKCNPFCEDECDYCNEGCEWETMYGGSCGGGGGGGGNDVPEFSAATLALAVIGAGLGIALLRKKH
jgi:hypothetical protein